MKEKTNELLSEGERYFQEGNNSQAKKCFQEILSTEPNHLEARNNLGVLLFHEGKINQSIDFFKNILKEDSRNEDALANLEMVENYLKEKNAPPQVLNQNVRNQEAITKIPTTEILPKLDQQRPSPQTKLEKLKGKVSYRINIVALSDMESDRERILKWGDYWIKQEFEKEFSKAGHIITDNNPDIIFHMFGGPLRYVPEDTWNIIWIHSHPDWITPELLKQYDQVYCLSPMFTQKISKWGINADILIGGTSKTLKKGGNRYDIVFVANSKGNNGRKIVRDLGNLNDFPYNLKIWGEGWRGIIPERFYGGEYYNNSDLGRLYASSLICLNDHHEDMRINGFINPRILDILASGGFCISDDLAGLEDIVGDTVPKYKNPEELRSLIDYYISHPQEKEKLIEKGSRAAQTYSFEKMAEKIISSLKSRIFNDPGKYVQPMEVPNTIKLDLGCGSLKREGFVGLDMKAMPGVDIVCDVTKGIPLQDDCVEYLIADNLMEHIGDEFIDVMNDVWRICTPHAIIKIIVPGVHTSAAFQDPTHRRFFVPETFDYFNADHQRWKLYGSSYGIKPYKIHSVGLRENDKRFIEVEMTPLKDQKNNVRTVFVKDEHKSAPSKTGDTESAIKKVLVSFGFVPHATAGYLIRALKKRGCDVRSCGPLDKNSLLKTWTNEQLTHLAPLHDVITGNNTSILDVIRNFTDGWRPDLFLWVESSMTYPNFPSAIEQLPCPTAAYFIDSHTKLDWHLKFAPHFDTVFVAQKAYIPNFERAGCRHVAWLPLACDPGIHGKRKVSKNREISFVGHVYTGTDLYKRRNELLDLLKDKYDLKVEQKYFEEMAESFSRAHLVFNISAMNDLNMRVFEALASGSLLLTDRAPGSGLTDFFSDREDLIIYDDNKSLISLADYYLNHPQEAEKIALSGMKKVITHHTYENRVEEIFRRIVNDRVQPVKQIDARSMPDAPKMAISASQNSVSANDIGITLQEYPPSGKNNRNLRVLAAFAHFNWEDHNLQPALEEFGEVIRLRWPPYNQYEENWHFSKKQWFNIRLLEAIERVHATKPIDVFFGYLSGRLVFPSTIRTIGRMGIPALSMCLDDRTKFQGRLEPTGYAGMIDIASAFSLCWTSTEDAVKQYESVGARAIYLPEGANPLVYRPLNIPFDIDVSFVGQCYGQRPKIIEQLKNKGINVQTFGKGWPSGEITVEEMVQIYNRSRINIGFSMVGDHEDVFCLKGRDFEIPMSGGLYLTQFHPELGNVYNIGKEILCYQGLDDMVAKIRYYLEQPEKAEEVRKAGYERAIKEHTWVQRFSRAFEAMGLLK